MLLFKLINKKCDVFLDFLKTAQQIARLVLTLRVLSLFIPENLKPASRSVSCDITSFICAEIIRHSQLRCLYKQRKLSVTILADKAN